MPISADISTDTMLSIFRLRVLPIHRYISEAIYDDISECLPTASGVVSSSLRTPRRT